MTTPNPPGPSPELHWAILSDQGRVREHNEDRVARTTTPLGELLLVCDGMGGHRGGQTASSLALEYIQAELRAAQATEEPCRSLERALQVANEVIHRRAGDDPELHGMGTTAVAVLQRNDRIWFAYVGDSRLYLRRDGKLHRLTKDHTRAQAMVDQGVLTEEQAWDHPESGSLTRNLGGEPKAEPDVGGPVPLQPGDLVLLCSDGLSGLVPEARFVPLLDHGPVERLAQELVDLANECGGEDNISVALLRVGADPAVVPEPSAPSPGATASRRVPHASRRLTRPQIAARALAVALLVGAVVVWLATRTCAPDASPEGHPADSGRSHAAQPTPTAPPAAALVPVAKPGTRVLVVPGTGPGLEGVSVRVTCDGPYRHFGDGQRELRFVVPAEAACRVEALGGQPSPQQVGPGAMPLPISASPATRPPTTGPTPTKRNLPRGKRPTGGQKKPRRRASGKAPAGGRPKAAK